ncbi:MAG: hypothetical protein KKE69_02245 [Alphaproteobacteria bacterium]|nr:hypothetical protein [Alphaproteobacteria bacterium]MBU1606830.1 hypothetical protein [Alphaproteobacteria bacterium]
MRRYFFDTYDNQSILIDEEGLELASFDKVKSEAAASLAELAREVLPGSMQRNIAVKVRDDKARSILVAELTFEVRAHLQPVG